MHGAKLPPSSLHSKLATLMPLNSNEADALLLVVDGLRSIVVFGGVA